jgi:signal transduction histidine kinase
VHVRVEMKDGAVVLEVRDQGKGIPEETLKEPGYDGKAALGVGLRGMSERSKQLSGNLEVSSGSQGTTIRATIPCLREDAIPGIAVSAAAEAGFTSQKEQSQGAR